MPTTRRSRIRGDHDEVRPQEPRRRRQVDADIARIRRFDDTMPKAVLWLAVAIFVMVPIVAFLA